MKQPFKLFGLLIAGALALAVFLGSNAFSQEQEHIVLPPGPNVEATTVPANVTPGLVGVGPAMPEPPAATSLPVPTAVPVVDAPALPAPGAGKRAAASVNFSRADLAGWLFDQIYDDTQDAPAWSVQQGRLMAPPYSYATSDFNDLLALAPATGALSGVEGVAYARDASRLGLVLAYQDRQNYLALVLSGADAPGGAGSQLIQVANDQRTVLAEGEFSLERNRWYQLQLTLENGTLRAAVDGQALLSATLDTAPAGQRAGFYAGHEGFAHFDNLRLLAK